MFNNQNKTENLPNKLLTASNSVAQLNKQITQQAYYKTETPHKIPQKNNLIYKTQDQVLSNQQSRQSIKDFFNQGLTQRQESDSKLPKINDEYVYNTVTKPLIGSRSVSQLNKKQLKFENDFTSQKQDRIIDDEYRLEIRNSLSRQQVEKQFHPIRPLQLDEKVRILDWKNLPKRQTYLDQAIKESAKPGHMAPNAYFKVEKNEKGGVLSTSQFVTEDMYTTKKYSLSKEPKTSFITQLQKFEKKKIGPNHYQDVVKGKQFLYDKSGIFHKGIIKSDIEQGLFIIDAQIKGKVVPSPQLYNPEHKLTEPRIYQANMMRDVTPQRSVFQVKKGSPTPTTYPIEKKDERTILSTKEKAKSMKIFVKIEENGKKQKLKRYLDLHQKSKEWLPPLTKYHVDYEKIKRFTSTSPNRLAHKR